MQDPNHDHDKKCNCKCCPGPMGHDGKQGPKGEQGVPGIQGVPGVNGVNGVNGVDGQMGAQGPMGPVGPAGEQGPMGPKGDCIECPCDCKPEEPEFAQVYSTADQNLFASPGINLPGGVVLFENAVFATPNIDITNAALLGQIKVNKAGWYTIEQSVCGTLNPLSAPLIVWGLAIFKNGLIIPGTTFVDMTLSPDQQANNTSSLIIVFLNVGDVLELHNMTTQNLLLNAIAAGTNGINAQSNSASFKIASIKFV
ncbi:MAG: hypothetical protein ACHQ1D_02965 [Nitrososphaerales archaeon]